jgi:chromosome partitioning protein
MLTYPQKHSEDLMRICTFNAKGGVGRTTTTLNLAGFYAQDLKRRVLVADCDPQGSALAWAALADETPFTVGRSRSRGFDVELLDLAPRIPENGLLPNADVYLIPTLLDGVSFVVFLRTIELMKEKGLPYLVIANRFNPNRAEHRERLASLDKPLVLRERSAFAAYYAEGRTVFDMTGRYIEDAQREIAQVAEAIGTLTKGRLN